MNKKLLAVSWYMPPLTAPRALQVSRTLKAAAERGWQCDVVTMHPREIAGRRDEQLAALYANAYRQLYVDMSEPPLLTRAYRRMRHRLSPSGSYLEYCFLFSGSRLLLNCLNSEPYDALVTFAQPWIDHVLGLAVKRRLPRVPWVAHFSDPWSDSPYHGKKAATESARRVEREQERAIVEKADVLVFVSQETADLVMRKYPDDWRRKAHVVPHGYDLGILPEVRPIPRPDHRLYLVHTGSFYPGMRMPNELLHALARLNETHAALNEVVIDFIGDVPEECRELVEQLGLFGQVRLLGSAGYFTSLAATAVADALILIDAPAKISVFLPSKIVDYLMVGKPILGLTPPRGASATILRQGGHLIAPPDDREAIYRVLVRILEDWRAGQLASQTSLEAIRSLDIRSTTALFESAVEAAIEAVRVRS